MKMLNGGKLIIAGLLTLAMTLSLVACDFDSTTDDRVNDIDTTDPTTEVDQSQLVEQEEYVEGARAQLEELEAEYEGLRNDIELEEGEVPAELEQALSDIDQQRTAAENALEDLETASEQTWANFRASVSSALQDFRDSLGNLETRIDTSFEDVDLDGDNL